eukprot:scaffold17.g540.t1
MAEALGSSHADAAEQDGGGGAPFLTIESVNGNLRAAEYAVRGAIAQRSAELQKKLAAGAQLPFKRIVACNIGNPQLLGQKPLTFLRQARTSTHTCTFLVLALCDYPALMDSPLCGQLFPEDAVARAREYLAGLPGGSTGAYTESQGALVCREHVAAGIAARDGHPCDAEDLWLTDGASPAVHMMMDALIAGEGDAILTPIPQYPLYSAAITLKGATLAPYYLDESQDWELSVESLQEAADAAKQQGKAVRALVVINPGNPTGQVLERANQEEIIRFCQRERLVLMADEVYQANIYAASKKFHSFKKVLRDMGPEYQSLRRRAQLVASTFNRLEGVSCNEVEGAMYAFPRLNLPPAALEAARQRGKPADFEYCWSLLEETGIVTVPGSGFGQVPSTLHLRTTILPPESDMEDVAQRMAAFHCKYLAQFNPLLLSALACGLLPPARLPPSMFRGGGAAALRPLATPAAWQRALATQQVVQHIVEEAKAKARERLESAEHRARDVLSCPHDEMERRSELAGRSTADALTDAEAGQSSGTAGRSVADAAAEEEQLKVKDWEMRHPLNPNEESGGP